MNEIETALRQSVVTIAEDWIGTPYRREHYPIKGKKGGCDCASFLAGVGMGALLIPKLKKMPAYSADRHVHRTDEAYKRILIEYGCVEIKTNAAQLGDILLQVQGNGQPASHAGIVSRMLDNKPAEIIHAHRGSSIDAVCRRPLDTPWMSRVRYAFRFPNVRELINVG